MLVLKLSGLQHKFWWMVDNILEENTIGKKATQTIFLIRLNKRDFIIEKQLPRPIMKYTKSLSCLPSLLCNTNN